MANKYVDEKVLNTSLSNFATKVSKNFPMKKEAIKSLSIEQAVPTGSTGTNKVQCLKIVYADDSLVDSKGQTVNHIVYLDLSTLGGSGTGGSGGGSYDDTDIKKIINMVNSDLNAHKSNADIHTTSGDKTRWNNKADISDIPTKLSQLSNDTKYINNTVNNLINYYNKSETYTKAEVANLIGKINHLDSVIVTVLPSKDISTTTIYLIKESTGIYSQHMYISGAWADLGSTQISLNNVYTKTEADSKFALKTSIPTVPTKVSELTNDSGYLTKHQDLSDYAKKSDIKTLSKVPTKVSELTNDSGYITFTDVVSIDKTTKHWKINNKDTGVLAEGTKGKDGADGVILDNIGYFGLRVEDSKLMLYVNVPDASSANVDDQAPPFSLENGSLYYTVGGTIQYVSKRTI